MFIFIKKVLFFDNICLWNEKEKNKFVVKRVKKGNEDKYM